jgi:predicted phage terminase large subunit-like protein
LPITSETTIDQNIAFAAKSKRLRKNQSFEDWLVKTSPQYTWDYPHLKFIRKHLTSIADGARKKIMIFMPPQHGKSLHTTIHFPAFCLTKNPKYRIIIGAYNYTYAQGFSIKAKRLLISNNYSHFAGKQTASDWETDQDGFLKSFGIQSGITGTPSDITFLDDPVKGYEAAFSEKIQDKIWNEYEYSIQTRSQEKSSIVIIQTRWVYGGLTDRILKSEGEDEWIIIKLPALAEENDPLGRKVGEALCPQLHSREKLEKIKLRNPSLFQALYQQSPAPLKGNIFKIDWFKYYTKKTLPQNFEYILISLDSAWEEGKKNSYSVLTVWGVRSGLIYLLEVIRGQPALPELLRTTANLYKSYLNKNLWGILIEKKQSGYAVIQTFRRNPLFKVLETTPKDSKVVRAHAITSTVEAQLVYLPDNTDPEIDAPWMYDFLTEVKNFPKSDTSDIVDSMTQAIEYINIHFLCGLSNFDVLCE